MSERDSGGTSIGDAIGMAVIIFALVMFLILIAIVTFLASPGMVIVGSAKLVFGLTHSGRQVWVLSIAFSLTILIVLVFAFRDVAKGVSAHLLLCAVTMILWSVLTYGFESRATESLAAVFFPGFTIKEERAAEAIQKAAEPPTGINQVVAEAEHAEPEEPPVVVVRRTEVVVPPPAEPPPTPTPVPMASFRVALQLPLKHAYVMVRLDDREVFRCDFRSGSQDGTPALLTPPIEATAGPVVVKVWVISPDKKAADEYVVLPVKLEAGESRRLGLVLDPTRELKGRLLAEPFRGPSA